MEAEANDNRTEECQYIMNKGEREQRVLSLIKHFILSCLNDRFWMLWCCLPFPCFLSPHCQYKPCCKVLNKARSPTETHIVIGTVHRKYETNTSILNKLKLTHSSNETLLTIAELNKH